jgi:hypothetical protein
MIRKLFYFIVVIVLILAITPLNAGAELASFSVLDYNLNSNSEFNVVINVQDLVEAGTVEFVLEYDSSLITYLNASSGALMAPDLGLLDAINSVGHIENLSIAIATMNQSVSGSGDLASLNFRSNSRVGSGKIIIKSMTIYPSDFNLPPVHAVTGSDISFTVSNVNNISISVLAESWEYGSTNPYDSEYWNLQAVNPKTEFLSGESLCVLSKVKNMTSRHRWKTEFYRNDVLVWTDESPWLYVGSGWDYANSMPTLFNLQAGHGRVNVWLDTGSGYRLKTDTYYNVISDQTENEYLGASLCDSWIHGGGNPAQEKYWNLQCVNPRIFFEEGQRAYLLTQVGNISIEHEWKFEVYHNGVFLWDYSSGLQNTNGDHWSYSNFAPYIDNVRPGNYKLKVFFKTKQGFNLLDTKIFNVAAVYNNSIPYLANFNTANFGFV